MSGTKLSAVIPAHNEAAALPETISQLHTTLQEAGIDHELLVVNDNSSDDTIATLDQLKSTIPSLRYVTNPPPRNGYGYAVRKGLDHFSGDIVAIVMADLSDSPDDVVKYYRTMVDGNYDCVFGNRFIRGGRVINYPFFKLTLNRLANNLLSLLFRAKYNDVTNAFKMYRRETIQGLRPFLSPHFNLTIELPLKAIVRGYSYAVVPNSWTGRRTGQSKLKIREMGSRYLFIMLYCLIEKYFSKGDFDKDPRHTGGTRSEPR